MSDITDLLSIRSNAISTTPLKSYVATYSTVSNSIDEATGITLSVPNNWYYYVSFQLQSGSCTATAKLKIGSTTVQSWSNQNSGGNPTNNDEVSLVYKNTTGSTQTVILTVQCSASGGVGRTIAASLISGLFIGTPPSGLPYNNLSSIVWQFSGQVAGVVQNATVDGDLQITSTTTAVTSTLTTNPILGSGNLFQFTGNAGLIAYDFTGTYASI